MAKLIYCFRNDSDFYICVWLVKSGKYVVTTYDTVNKTHDKQGSFNTKEEATKLAQQINKDYMFENKKHVKLSESTLRQIVAESVKKVLMEEREFGYSLMSVLATAADYMRCFGYEKGAKLIEDYIEDGKNYGDHPEFDKNILEVLESAEKDIRRRIKENPNAIWDDVDDFINILLEARQSYLLACSEQ